MSHLLLTVSQLNLYAKNVLEQDSYLANVFVTGEISNFTNHYRSGHWYFSLKDQNAVISGVMFRSANMNLPFQPQDGMKVICRGRVSIYDRDGRYQLYIEEMQPDGLGSLNLAYQQCKEKLEKAGLFDSSHKKPIPVFPKKIGVITSPTGAALQDILTVLTRRYPLATVVLCPVQVQGESAVAQLVNAVKTLSCRTDIQTIIIGRGGGSMEDLWAFNSEELAYAIYQCPIPVVSAVGHETDFTIADFVADLRAPTPSAAAELVVPDQEELLAGIGGYRRLLKQYLGDKVMREQERLTRLLQCVKLTKPVTLLEPFEQQLDGLTHRLFTAWQHAFSRFETALQLQQNRLTAYSPLGALQRGYSIVKLKGKPVNHISQLQAMDAITLQLQGGEANCVVQSVSQKEET